MNYNQEMKKYGNMTNVEKRLNKKDLQAYKTYDNRQYSMMPGVKSFHTGLAAEEAYMTKREISPDE